MVVGQSPLWHDKEAIRGDWRFFIFNQRVVVHYNETKPEENQMAQGHIARFHKLSLLLNVRLVFI